MAQSVSHIARGPEYRSGCSQGIGSSAANTATPALVGVATGPASCPMGRGATAAAGARSERVSGASTGALLIGASGPSAAGPSCSRQDPHRDKPSWLMRRQSAHRGRPHPTQTAAAVRSG